MSNFTEEYMKYKQRKIDKLNYLLSLTRKSSLRRKYINQIKRIESRIEFLRARL